MYHRIASRKITGILKPIVFFIIMMLLHGCGFATSKVHVALITFRDVTQHGTDLLEGARTAADKYGLSCQEYLYENSATLSSSIKQAKEDGADAIVLEMDHSLSRSIDLPENTLPLVTIGGVPDDVPIRAAVLNRENSMGENMGRELHKRVGLQTHVALIADTPELSVYDERETRLRDNLGYCGSTIVKRANSHRSQADAYRETLEIISEHPEVRAVIAFGAPGTLGAATAVSETGRDVCIIGTDVMPGTVEKLETGEIDAIFIRRSFAMGYRGIETIAHVLAEETVPERFYLDSAVADHQNLYTPNIEILLFPMDSE